MLKLRTSAGDPAGNFHRRRIVRTLAPENVTPANPAAEAHARDSS
jgi:hypothetical protein